MNLSEPYTTHTCNIQYMPCMCGLYMYIDINLFCVSSCLAVEVFLVCSRVPVTVIKNVHFAVDHRQLEQEYHDVRGCQGHQTKAKSVARE